MEGKVRKNPNKQRERQDEEMAAIGSNPDWEEGYPQRMSARQVNGHSKKRCPSRRMGGYVYSCFACKARNKSLPDTSQIS